MERDLILVSAPLNRCPIPAISGACINRVGAILVFWSELNGCKKQYTAPDIVYSLSVANQAAPLKNEQPPRCSPPYELLCAPPPFGWLRQVRYRVFDRLLNVVMLVGWYLLGRPPAEKSTYLPHRHFLVPGSFVWLAGAVLCN